LERPSASLGADSSEGEKPRPESLERRSSAEEAPEIAEASLSDPEAGSACDDT